MKRLLFVFIGMLAISAFGTNLINQKWGFFGHKKIAELAIYTLPAPLIIFYKNYSTPLVEQSVSADKRRYVIEEEGPRHYIDLDLYVEMDSLPKYWREAVDRFGKDSLQARGVVPWHAQLTFHRLVAAMTAHDINRIIRYSADLSHYIADAHVPLHTTSNYNGQFTNQVGIHAFWESRLPELYAENYNFFVGKADYIPDTQKAIWEAVFEANTLVDSLLILDLDLTRKIGEDKKYAFEQRGKSTVKVASRQFSKQYHDSFPMVEAQMKASIKMVGDFWYTAWIEAGQPDLLENTELEASVEADDENAAPLIAPDRVHQH